MFMLNRKPFKQESDLKDLLLKGAIIEHRKNKKALSTKGSTAYHQYANFFNDMDKN